jgi:hypothetical protein
VYVHSSVEWSKVKGGCSSTVCSVGCCRGRRKLVGLNNPIVIRGDTLQRAVLGTELFLALPGGSRAADGYLAKVPRGSTDADHPIRELYGDLAPGVGAHGGDDAEQHPVERGQRQRLWSRGEIAVNGIDSA